jgi:hypothetical protein
MNALAFYQKISGLGRVTTREAAQITGLEIPAASMALRRLAAEGLARAFLASPRLQAELPALRAEAALVRGRPIPTWPKP